ncbi:alpha/beta hydrolase family protein [Geojedonia litorea]|uniref:Alpha/beta hydrolase family protein n=1 Tax=Geojedonia litorea TaxID=1268269 RepID=A0ABV9N1L8_9FLAO
MKLICSSLLIIFSISISAQKKVLNHSDVELWKTISSRAISPDGNYVTYDLERDNSDSHLYLKSANGTLILDYERGTKGQFSYDSKFLNFIIKPFKDSIDDMQRRKVKKDKLPKDTLAIYNLSTRELIKIPNVKSFDLPEKWSGYVAYYLEDIKEEKKATKDDDTTATKKEAKKKTKKVSKKNGYHLVLHQLTTKAQDTFTYVTHHTFAERGEKLAFITTGDVSNENSGVFVKDLKTSQISHIHKSDKANYDQLKFSETGKRLGFIVDQDTTKVQVRPNELYTWAEGASSAQKRLDNSTAPKGYLVSSDGKISFSKDESKLYFGLRLPPIVKDTTLLKDEISNVEVWTYNEPRLYTVQELQVKSDTIKSFQTVFNFKTNTLVQLGNADFEDIDITDEGNANVALIRNSTPYELESQWTGQRFEDYALVNTNTGATKHILTKVASANLSPKGKYVYGYRIVDSTWFSYNVATGKYNTLTKGKIFYDELNDSPNYPYAYGLAGWTEDDKHLLIYDRYDIWKVNPETGQSTNLTNGRSSKTVYRYLKLDREEHYIDSNKNWLLSTFNETSKDAGYASFNPKNNNIKVLEQGPYQYSRPIKAELSDALLFTRESFSEFPELRLTDLSFKQQTVLSNANPQQSDYNWGTIELVNWISLDGKELSGMLVKPENFDPNKKYPMIVNFYERSSDGLHNHREPSYGRSTINYSFYASRGYLIFNPDVEYRVGYPGESALNCVVSGVTALIAKGFVDKDNIGVQGHSWGGYQIAYLVTKTDIFKAAESGAPVPNMISAYGGIRWWTGLSRQFQYEHTQSRIGGTPWEYPQRYIENSPIFNIDKINTPLLIMHNDADGHVPWYQGIEFFTSLRRLGKPSWFLNYNGEPHWPLKYPNRKDFNIRMAQFFDHYLKGEPMPVWMDRGVPAVEKGINQGYELLDTSKN